MHFFSRNIVLFFLFSFFVFSIQSAFAAEPNTIEIDQFRYVLAEQQLRMQDGTTIMITMRGRATIHVIFEGTQEGMAYDDDGDSLDEVDTRMVELDLVGLSPMLGPVRMRLRTSYPSVGRMEETVNNKSGLLEVPPFGVGTIDSFFDVYLELETFGETFYGSQPMRWRARINRKPAAPGDIYENLEDIKLVDEYGRDTGYILGAVRYEPLACGDALHPYPIGDLNFNCEVNFKDVAIIGLHWLECTKPRCD